MLEVSSIVKKIGLAFLLCCNLLVVLPSGTVQGMGIVETVKVEIRSEETSLPPRIEKRMVASVKTIGEQMFIGNAEKNLIEKKQAYEQVIREVFDRVVFGYSVESVTLSLGVETKIQIVIKPWGEVVKKVDLEMDTAALPEEIIPLLQKDIGDVKRISEEGLLGLPVDSLDWAAGVSKLAIREFFSEELPEFRSSVEISGGTHTLIKVVLVPVGVTIQDFHVSLRSKSIPNVLLAQLRPAVEKNATLLTGLPAAFVERHRSYFEQRIQQAISQQPAAKNYGLSYRTLISPARDTDIRVDVETDKYKVALEGYMDMGKTTDNTSFRLHAGQFFTKRDEGFVEVNFIPASMRWEFVPGWGHRIGDSMQVGLKYNHSQEQAIGWLTQQLDRNWQLRVERMPKTGYNEFGLRYKLHDFLSAEYIVGQDESWLRLIGNL